MKSLHSSVHALTMRSVAGCSLLNGFPFTREKVESTTTMQCARLEGVVQMKFYISMTKTGSSPIDASITTLD